MPKPFVTYTTGPSWLGAVLCFVLGLFLAFTPILALVATWRTVNPADLLKIAVVLAGCFCAGFAFLVGGLVCIRYTLLPKTLRIKKGKFQLCRGERVLGEIPLANIHDIRGKTRSMAGQSANLEFVSGFLVGGLLGGWLRASRFDPNEIIAILVFIRDPDDSDWYWPTAPSGTKQNKIEIRLSWDLPFADAVKQLQKQLLEFQLAKD